VKMAEAGAERMRLSADSTVRRVQEESGAMETRFHGAEEAAVRWRWIAIGTGGLLVLVVIVLLYRSGRALRRIRKELTTVQAEVRTLMERPRVEHHEAPRQAAPVTVAAPEPPPSAPVVPPDDVLVAMFRKQAPERLATLRAARERADHEKTVRVVHSLKPQLVGFDGPRFAPLITRITAPDAAADTAKWNADLDALERGIAATLASIGH
jgi:hypothetical protein